MKFDNCKKCGADHNNFSIKLIWSNHQYSVCMVECSACGYFKLFKSHTYANEDEQFESAVECWNETKYMDT